MIRTLWLFSFVLLAPSLAQAEMSLGQLCKQLIGGQVTQCISAANGRYVDGSAAQICSHLIGGQVTACVSAVAGKDYSHDEADACGGLIGGQVVDCMRAAGHPHVDRRAVAPPPAQPPYYGGGGGGGGSGGYRGGGGGDAGYRGGLSQSDVRAEIAAALEALRANDPISAERRLRRLLNDMR